MIKIKLKQAFLIMAHNNINQLNTLLEVLDSDYSDVFLHIDAKSNINTNNIIKLKQSKLIICPSLNVYWSDYSQVECELSLLKKAIEGNYGYYHLISGADFPLKSVKEMYEYFKEKNDIFIHYTNKENLYKTFEYVKYYHVFQKKLHIVNRDRTISIYKVINKLFLFFQMIIGINRIEEGLEVKKGANWFSIPHDFARYLVEKEVFIREQFLNTRSPDEFFVQTLAYNSVFRDRIYNFKQDDSYVSCLRYIDWNRGTPHIFRNDDYRELINSNMFFARKFDIEVDANIIHRLAQSI